MKSKQKDLNIFSMPFTVEPANVPDNPQTEIIELQNIEELKARYNNLPLLEFYQVSVHPDKFPILRVNALKFASWLGTAYCLEQSFSSRTHFCTGTILLKTDWPKTKNLLWVASSSLPPFTY